MRVERGAGAVGVVGDARREQLAVELLVPVLQLPPSAESSTGR